MWNIVCPSLGVWRKESPITLTIIYSIKVLIICLTKRKNQVALLLDNVFDDVISPGLMHFFFYNFVANEITRERNLIGLYACSFSEFIYFRDNFSEFWLPKLEMASQSLCFHIRILSSYYLLFSSKYLIF